MKSRGKVLAAFAMLMGLFMITPPSFGATFTIEFSDSALVPDVANLKGKPGVGGIEAFTFWLYVGGDFAFDNVQLGSAIPTDGTLGWDIDSQSISNDPTYGLVFKLGAFDQDGLFLSDPHYMQDGIIASFDYGGFLGDFAVIQFDPGDGSNLYQMDSENPNHFDVIQLLSRSETGSTFSAIPIPSTLLLLGSGLVGLIGLKRRKRA
jgi:hypothetical protein